MCNRENRQVIWCSYLEIDVLVILIVTIAEITPETKLEDSLNYIINL